MMNILRLDPPSSKGARALDDHIEALLLLIHSKNLALSDLSEVENRPSRPLSAAELLLASVGEDAHQIALAVETLIDALRAQRYRRRTRFGSILLLMVPVLFIGMLLGAAYGIDEGRARERYDQEHPPIALPMLDAEVLKVR